MRRGVSPLIGAVLLLSIAVALAGSAYVFLVNQQESVEEGIEQAQLETVNITCNRQTVSWWIRNTAEYGVDDLQADLFIQSLSEQNQTHYTRTDLPLSLTSRESTGELDLVLSTPLDIGTEYRIELTTDEHDMTGTCRVGEPWWNVNWDYRRHIALDSGTVDADDQTSVQVDAEQLVQDGKLQPYCQDLRVVIGATAVPYNLSTSPQNCATTPDLDVTFQVNDISLDRHQTYLYYGNPAADNQSIQVTGSATQSPLGDEEHISRLQR